MRRASSWWLAAAAVALVECKSRESRERDTASPAACYGKRYPDLFEKFCTRPGRPSDGTCRRKALKEHWLSRRNRELRRFGCGHPTPECCKGSAADCYACMQRCPETPANATSCNLCGPCAGERMRFPGNAENNPPFLCGRVAGFCALGRYTELHAGELRAGKHRNANPAALRRPSNQRVCTIVRTYDGHANTIALLLESLLAASRVAHVDIEFHVLNTDRRKRLGDEFLSQVSKFEDAHANEYVDTAPYGVPPAENDYGYVATDLTLLRLRARGGCDVVLVTHGDNAYNVDFLRLALWGLNKRAAVAVATDFWSHYKNRVKSAAFQKRMIDLGSAVPRASYLDAKNLTFVLGDIETGALNPRHHSNFRMGSRVFAADWALFQRIAQDVGAAGARVVHETLFFHL